MEYSFYDFLKLIGSLGLFLYGMKIMSEGLQKVAGDRLRSILTAMTTNRVTGVLTGVLITALIQSSSATTVMVVSFVNAGLLTLAESISVIMGANIGTTVTAWIISIFGFKVDMAAFALPLLAIALPLIFSGKSNRKSVGEFIFGFSFLFMGLSYLKANAPDLNANPEMLAFVQNYTDMGFFSILLFLFIGTILTMIVQASAATMAITLIMCANGWISLELGAALVLGENIGTTITANLAALTANTQAKRAALAHFVFNVFGVIWVRTFNPPSLQEVLTKLPKTHPRILLDAEDWDNIIERNKNNPEAQAYIRKADKCLNHPLKHLEEEIDTTQVVKLTNIVQYRSALIRESRKIVDREEANIEAMVRAYLLTKDEVYYKEGIKRLSEILSWKKSKYFAGDFNRSTILSMSTSAYDAWYNLLTPNERKLLLRTIRDNGKKFYHEYVNHLENRIADNHVWQMTFRILNMAAFATYGELPMP